MEGREIDETRETMRDRLMEVYADTKTTSRTMIAEITKEKKYQSRAFLILPMSFNVASMLGPGTASHPRLELLANTTPQSWAEC